MEQYEFTKHAKDMILEREIQEHWIIDTINYPNRIEMINNEEIHYIKQIKEFGNRFFRIVVNPYTNPKRIITLFFDRRVTE